MSVRRLGLAVLASLCMSVGALVLSAPVLALNVHTFSFAFGGEGSEDGKLKEPRGIAVNDTTHDVYVAEQGNSRVEEFTSAGVYVRQFAPPGGFVGGFEKEDPPTEIAVDNSSDPLDPSAGDVYVADRPHKAVDKFSSTGVYEGQLTVGHEAGSVPVGVAVDSTGVLWVKLFSREGEIESFSDAQPNVFQSLIFGSDGAFPGFAIDSEDGLYVSDGLGFQRRTVSGESYEVQVGGNITGFALDASDSELYVGLGEQVKLYDSRKVLREGFGAGHLTETGEVAVDSSTHAVYVVDKATDQIVVFDQIVLPDVSTGEAPTNLQHEGSVTLGGTVNPDGIPVTGCELEYGTDTSYGTTVPCEPSPGAGSVPVAVHADVSGLTPLTLYHYRLVAGNANGSNPGIDRTFIAPTPPRVSGESVFDVSAGSATLAGRVNPGGADTTYRFEYGPSVSYGESVSGDAGSGVGDVEVRAHPQDLQQGTLYHYRLVAENPLETVAGEDHTFTTERVAGKLVLPDGRMWEMVSPPNKQGATLIAPGGEDLIQAGVDGGVISYVANGPTEVEPAGNRAPENVQVFSQRGAGGWATRVVATAHDATHLSSTVGDSSEYKWFSSDLSLGLVEPQGARPLSGESSEQTPYLRRDGTCEASPATCYQPLVTAANVASGVKFGSAEGASLGEVEFAGATPDLSHVVLRSKVALTSDGTPGLYEWADGKLTFVADMELGFHGTVVRHTVSDDGERIIGTGTSEGLQGLLMRDIATGKTIKLDAGEPGSAGGEGRPVFQTASSDGSRVFFTDAARLTADSTATQGAPDLYEFDVETRKLTDLSVDPHPGEHANVLIVLSSSDDGSYVYFAASGALAGPATAGDCNSREPEGSRTCNVYVSHGGTTKLVAVLSDEDAVWSGLNQSPDLAVLTARVSTDGRWFVFMSNRSLTGYDNRDVRTGKHDEEVFLYDASTEHVVCASCEPTGGRPTGMFVTTDTEAGETTPLIDHGSVWDNVGLAATVPNWTSVSGQKAFYQAHYVSNSGRLFFNGDGALVPQDTNGTWDVYEYEPPEVGDCQPTSPTFSEASGGCVGLISSGGAQEESIFLDASETGDEVFFLTGAGLLPQDYDGGRDVYDAHVCSTQSPCFPVAPATPPPCSTGDSCKAAPSPQPEVFGAPSSETFSGTGNVVIGGAGQSVQPRSLTRAQKLRNALKACHRRRAKGKRLVCERQARKRYAKKAVKSAAGKSVSHRTGR